MGDHYKFFQNSECEFFPCHKLDKDKFNCLFCYCPLYLLKEDCGGNYIYLDNGIKDCSNCILPHEKDSGYAHVIKKMGLVIERAMKDE